MSVPSKDPSGIPVPVRWTDDGSAVALLDQTLLPEDERYLRLERVDEVAEAITALRVRGAPAIGIAAAMGLTLGAMRRLEAGGGGLGGSELAEGVRHDARILAATRPTAINLAWALDRIVAVVDALPDAHAGSLVEAMASEATAIAAEDREMCSRIGRYGVEVIPEEGCGILTHCNAGALATGGVGTALAPVYEAHSRGIPVRLYADETRPLLQGARLTAWEAGKSGVDVTVLTDSMAAVLMREGKVNLVIVGADRVAANGDVANKIGTYGVAVLARHHGIPFYVALPRSTFDTAVAGGEGIPIEERDPWEVTRAGGSLLVPEWASVWNPAFDVTPSHLVTAFITDVGVLRPPYEPAIRKSLETDFDLTDRLPGTSEETP